VNYSDPSLSVVRAVGINLSTRMATIWRWSKAKVNRFLGNAFKWTRTTYWPTLPLPYELAEMIIAHPTHDLDTLKACSLTCRSWYIIAVPHLHHTLTLKGGGLDFLTRGKLKPLSELHRLGLMPLVKVIRVDQPLNSGYNWFAPQAFSHRDLRYFSAFANVHTLVLQRFKIYRFIPRIERYFEHFSPTLQSITLFHPRCTPRQLSHFLSLFPNLDNIEIRFAYMHTPVPTVPDTELVPFSAPNLRGRLVLHHFHWADTWTHLITPCGGPRFRSMTLRGSGTCTPALLEACAGTLEMLGFNVTDGSRSVGEISVRAKLRVQADGKQGIPGYRS